jgi:hypothetical protein
VPAPTTYGYRVWLILTGSVITSKLYFSLATATHDHHLETHIIKTAKWSASVFNLIDRAGLKRAFTTLTWHQKISTSKLIHGLANTNRQNRLHYNTTDSCPCCDSSEEIFEHILTCPSLEMTTAQDLLLKQLDTNLNQLSMIPPVIHTILLGFSSWLHSPQSRVRPPMAGSFHYIIDGAKLA